MHSKSKFNLIYFLRFLSEKLGNEKVSHASQRKIMSINAAPILTSDDCELQAERIRRDPYLDTTKRFTLSSSSQDDKLAGSEGSEEREKK